MRLQDYDTSEPFQARVIATQRITADASSQEVRELLLDIPRPLEVSAGQSLGVLAPGNPAFGQHHHFRLYTVADLPERTEDEHTRIRLCVRRCTYVDDYSGEEYPGVASNYLCDLREGDSLTLAGPYGMAFEVPRERDASLILIGAGTGIAPFRAFVKHLFHEAEGFIGQVMLFHGAASGLELLYQNDQIDDFSQYMDNETFAAISALSPRPHWGDAIDWGAAIESRAGEIWRLLGDPRTYVYVAGLEEIRAQLDAVFARVAGDEEAWLRRKAELEAGRRWVELLY